MEFSAHPRHHHPGSPDPPVVVPIVVYLKTNIWIWICPAIACLASVLASIVLLWRLRRLRHAVERRLMGRQIWHISLADLLAHLMAGCWFAVDIVSYLDYLDEADQSFMDGWCSVLYQANAMGFMVSLFVEMHLAVAFMAATGRWAHLLRLLRPSLGWTWPIGIFVAFTESFSTKPTWLRAYGCSTRGQDLVGSYFVIACFCVCGVCYVVSACMVRSAGRVVRDRVWNRAYLYPLVCLITLFPNMLKGFSKTSPLMTNAWIHAIVLSLYNSNGLMNVIVYAIQSRTVRRLKACQEGAHARVRRRRARAAQWPPIPLNGEVVDEPTVESNCSSVNSYHVGFRDQNSIVEVVAVQAEALQRAESETSLLFGCFEDCLPPESFDRTIDQIGNMHDASSSLASCEHGRSVAGSSWSTSDDSTICSA